MAVTHTVAVDAPFKTRALRVIVCLHGRQYCVEQAIWSEAYIKDKMNVNCSQESTWRKSIAITIKIHNTKTKACFNPVKEL